MTSFDPDVYLSRLAQFRDAAQQRRFLSNSNVEPTRALVEALSLKIRDTGWKDPSLAEAVAESEPKEEIPFMVGQGVEITEGPFSDFSGTVAEVLADKGMVRVSGSLVGRPTAVSSSRILLEKWICPGG